jgi:hypothetical protein
MTDVFISYAKEDARRIERLARALELKGLDVFWDRKIPGGMSWRDYIGTALASSKCITVAWSEGSIKSAWVNEEADYGKDRAILVPLLLDAVRPPLGFGGLQAIDLSNWDGDASAPEFEQLLRDIERVSGAEPSSGLTNRSVAPNQTRAEHADNDVAGASHGPSARLKRVLVLATGVGVAAATITWLMHSQVRLSDTNGQSINSFDSEQPRQSANSAKSPPATTDSVSPNPAASGSSHSPETKSTSISTLSETVAARAGKPDAKGGAVGLYFDVTQVDGAFVKSVRANGPGAVAGIRAGDVVTAINGKVVLNGREADELILAAVPGTSLTITIERDGITLAYRVTVEKFGREEAEFYSSVMDAQYQQPARNAIRKMNR